MWVQVAWPLPHGPYEIACSSHSHRAACSTCWTRPSASAGASFQAALRTLGALRIRAGCMCWSGSRPSALSQHEGRASCWCRIRAIQAADLHHAANKPRAALPYRARLSVCSEAWLEPSQLVHHAGAKHLSSLPACRWPYVEIQRYGLQPLVPTQETPHVLWWAAQKRTTVQQVLGEYEYSAKCVPGVLAFAH